LTKILMNLDAFFKKKNLAYMDSSGTSDS